MQILYFKEGADQARRLAKTLNVESEAIAVHHFPDGESKVTLPEHLDAELIIYRSLDHPNNKLIELFLSCQTARQMGVKHITLIAPYLCYMRQDIAFHAGEVISQQVIGNWLGGMVNKLITVDPHLHRIERLEEAIPNTESITLSAAPLMAEFLKKRPSPPLLLGPDMESEQWVKQIAEMAQLDWAIATKTRLGDHQVQINLPDIDFNDRTIVIVDDVVSTGYTIANTAKELKHEGASVINCLVTHPLFSHQTEQVLANACINHVWSTNSITHHSNTISLVEMLAEAI